ncbi:MAG TPA: 7-carboxy-7-deazaguanine synthase QueE [Vicinamibacteria bacterium]
MGTRNVFVRFAACNLRCDVAEGESSPGGFACDTEFESGRPLGAEEIVAEAEALWGAARAERWVVLTGGEPALQVDAPLVEALRAAGFRCAMETNGTVDVGPLGLDWLTVSPKVAEHAVKPRRCHEVKYVRGFGQGIPRPAIEADHHLIAPAYEGDVLPARTLEWCVRLVKDHPGWRLSPQLHKHWGIR